MYNGTGRVIDHSRNPSRSEPLTNRNPPKVTSRDLLYARGGYSDDELDHIEDMLRAWDNEMGCSSPEGMIEYIAAIERGAAKQRARFRINPDDYIGLVNKWVDAANYGDPKHQDSNITKLNDLYLTAMSANSDFSIAEDAEMALRRAAEHWDSERGPFEPYAERSIVKAIRKACHDALRAKRSIPTMPQPDDNDLHMPSHHDRRPDEIAETEEQLRLALAGEDDAMIDGLEAVAHNETWTDVADAAALPSADAARKAYGRLRDRASRRLKKPDNS